ncbi:MAG: NAD-dependent epimerase/dehydratase family protein [Planctomycetes bacterium]|nr:NAD-dependent epimerase/dehydratase family protein [Planctomycetota bacterium]
MASSGIPSRRRRVALLGTGFIAGAHVAALRALGDLELWAVCDRDHGRLHGFARRHGIGRACADLDALLATSPDVVHVLTPPDRHAEAVRRCLEAGVAVLAEKPLVLGAEEARELGALAAARGLALGVNHNLVFHPAFVRLRRLVARGAVGRLEHLDLVHHVPLRQLHGGDLGAWVLRAPEHILYEQAVHPLSLVVSLLGPARTVQVQTSGVRVLDHGGAFVAGWSLAIVCARGTAQLWLGFGRSQTETTVHALGTDGTAWLDLARGTLLRGRKTRWPDMVDAAANEAGRACEAVRRAVVEPARYVAGLFGLGAGSDPHARSMRASVQAFHAALGRGAPPPCDAAHAAEVLAVCDAAAAAVRALPRAQMPFQPPPPVPPRRGEIAVIGAAGFVGRGLVAEALAQGLPVTLVVRRPEALPLALRGPELRVLQADARDPQALGAALAGVRYVVHLATAAGEDPAQVAASMVQGADAVASACLAQGVERLVYVSSSAALYLGGRRPVSDDAGPDPMPSRRGAYAQGKIAAEARLRERARGEGLRLVVVRPAIVVGSEAALQHPGVGIWVRDGVCVGYGLGRQPLPFVLVRDVARALLGALRSEAAVGRSYDLAGDVRLGARAWLAAVQERRGRRFVFVPRPLWLTWTLEAAKWLIKRLAGRPASWVSARDLASRSFRAPIVCEAARRDLGFAPEPDRTRFLAAAIPPAAEGGEAGP